MSYLGIHQNNPGNIRVSHIYWHGELPVQRGDRFARFSSAEFGLRAVAVILKTYQEDRECPSTIRGWISRWAPKSDHNPVDAYISLVCFYAHKGPDEPIDIHDFATAEGVIRGIVHQENGQQPYDDDTIAQGLALAGIVPVAASQPLVA